MRRSLKRMKRRKKKKTRQTRLMRQSNSPHKRKPKFTIEEKKVRVMSAVIGLKSLNNEERVENRNHKSFQQL